MEESSSEMPNFNRVKENFMKRIENEKNRQNSLLENSNGPKRKITKQTSKRNPRVTSSLYSNQKATSPPSFSQQNAVEPSSSLAELVALDQLREAERLLRHKKSSQPDMASSSTSTHVSTLTTLLTVLSPTPVAEEGKVDVDFAQLRQYGRRGVDEDDLCNIDLEGEHNRNEDHDSKQESDFAELKEKNDVYDNDDDDEEDFRGDDMSDSFDLYEYLFSRGDGITDSSEDRKGLLSSMEEALPCRNRVADSPSRSSASSVSSSSSSRSSVGSCYTHSLSLSMGEEEEEEEEAHDREYADMNGDSDIDTETEIEMDIKIHNSGRGRGDSGNTQELVPVTSALSHSRALLCSLLRMQSLSGKGPLCSQFGRTLSSRGQEPVGQDTLAAGSSASAAETASFYCSGSAEAAIAEAVFGGDVSELLQAQLELLRRVKAMLPLEDGDNFLNNTMGGGSGPGATHTYHSSTAQELRGSLPHLAPLLSTSDTVSGGGGGGGADMGLLINPFHGNAMARIMQMLTHTIQSIELDDRKTNRVAPAPKSSISTTKTHYRYDHISVDDEKGSEDDTENEENDHTVKRGDQKDEEVRSSEPKRGRGRGKDKDKERDSDSLREREVCAQLQVSTGSLAMLALTGRILRAEQRIVALRRLYHQVRKKGSECRRECVLSLAGNISLVYPYTS